MITARAAAINAAGGQVSEALVPGVMAEFVEFAYGGAFTFILASAAEP